MLKCLVLILVLTLAAMECRSADNLQDLKAKAEQGDVSAQYNLGAMYHDGQGVPQDYAEAVKWVRRAADQGDADAQYNLGAMYHDGQGVPQDDMQAYTWLNLAASRFPAGADYNRAAKARDTVAAKMTPAQIAAAQKLVREWKPTLSKP